MIFAKRLAGAAALGAAVLLGSGLSAPPTRAAYIVTLTQEGNDGVATGTGAIDTTDLIFMGTNAQRAAIQPVAGVINTGPIDPETVSVYGIIGDFPDFGKGLGAFANDGSGDFVGINSVANALWLPVGYVSGNPLSDSSTYENQSFGSLHLIVGTYEWDWGHGAHADSFTLDINGAAAVPEPPSLLLLGLPLALVMLLAARAARPSPINPCLPTAGAALG